MNVVQLIADLETPVGREVLHHLQTSIRTAGRKMMTIREARPDEAENIAEQVDFLRLDYVVILKASKLMIDQLRADMRMKNVIVFAVMPQEELALTTEQPLPKLLTLDSPNPDTNAMREAAKPGAWYHRFSRRWAR